MQGLSRSQYLLDPGVNKHLLDPMNQTLDIRTDQAKNSKVMFNKSKHDFSKPISTKDYLSMKNLNKRGEKLRTFNFPFDKAHTLTASLNADSKT